MTRPAATSGFTRVLSRILPARHRSSSRGGALIYVIASLVLLGVIGGGVAYFSSSSSTSQLAQTRAEQAYYAALAGQEYLEQQHKYYEMNPANQPKNKVFQDFQDAIAANGGVRSLDATRRFMVTVATPSTSEPFLYTGSVLGSHIDAQGNITESYHIAQTRVGSAVEPFDPVDPDDLKPPRAPDEMGRMTPVVTSGAHLDTGVYGEKVELGNES